CGAGAEGSLRRVSADRYRGRGCRRGESLAEGRASQARTDARVPEAAREKGRTLYLAVKMESDGFIAWLESGLPRRFNRIEEPAEFKDWVERTDKSVEAFLEWAQTLPPSFGGADGNAALADIANELIKGARETDEKMIDRLREDLGKCRLRDWSEP